MKPFVIGFLLVLFLPVRLLSQEVIGSQGAFSSNPTGSLSWTLGEFISETISSADGTLTQGFQQIILSGAALNEFAESPGAHIYPNPFHSNITIINPTIEGDFEFVMFDNTGKNIFRTTLEFTSAIEEYKIDLSHIASGAYHLQLHSADRSIVMDRILKY